MRLRNLTAAFGVLLVSGCSKPDGALSAKDCFERFHDEKVSLLLDRWVSNEGDDIGTFKVAFEITASDRPQNEFEQLLLRLAPTTDMSLGKIGESWKIRVREPGLYRTSFAIDDELRRVCAVAAANSAALSEWEVNLDGLPLTDNRNYLAPVP